MEWLLNVDGTAETIAQSNSDVCSCGMDIEVGDAGTDVGKGA